MKISFKKALLLVTLIGLLVRLYKINTPLADWHSFRQADTASVTREYVKHGTDLLHPHYHDLSNIQSGIRVQGADNVEGLRMVEFPFVNAGIASVLRSFPSFDLVITSRLFSIGASLLSIVGIAIIGSLLFGKKAGLFAATFFALNPYSVYYSRVILPEPFLVTGIVFSTLFFLLYQREMKKNDGFISFRPKTLFLALLFTVSFACSLLLKPMAIFYLPLLAGIAWVERGFKGILDPLLALFGAASILPFLMWRKWIDQYPIGIPASDWLFNGNGIRFRPAWFRWLFWERLTKLILGYAGIFFLLPLLATLFPLKRKPVLSLFIGAIGVLGYLSVFATGNVQHDYYQVLLTPYIALCVGYGWSWFWSQKKAQVRILSLMIFALSFWFSWKQVSGYYNVNNWAIVHAGQRADAVLPANAKVIAPYQGDTAFLFQINRTGWPIGFEIEKKISEGAQYYVSVNYDDEARDLEKQYATVEKTSEYIILDLTKKL